MSAAPGTATRLEKAALDNGFDLVRAAAAGWLQVASSHARLEVWLTIEGGAPVAAFSRADVVSALGGLGAEAPVALPAGTVAALAVRDVGALHRLLRRAYQLARSLPTALLDEFAQRTAALGRMTEAERLIVQRVGQDVFRAGLLEYWEGRCAVTGLAVPELLRASHVKPWADCATDAERLDVFNGLLLAPHLDAVFDAGFITVEDDGEIVVSSALPPEDRTLLGLDAPLRVGRLDPGHRPYLAWHRHKEFRKP